MAIQKSRWTRDLSNRDVTKHPSDHLTGEQIAEVMASHVNVRPKPEEYVRAVQSGDMHAIDHAKRSLAARESAADEFDDETVAAAIAGAQAVVDKLGPSHVVLCGSTRLDGDPSSGNQGSRLTVVQIIVTRVSQLTG